MVYIISVKFFCACEQKIWLIDEEENVLFYFSVCFSLYTRKEEEKFTVQAEGHHFDNGMHEFSQRKGSNLFFFWV